MSKKPIDFDDVPDLPPNKSIPEHPSLKEFVKDLFKPMPESEKQEQESLISIEKILNVSSLKDNDVVFFKIKELTPGLASVIKAFSERYGKTLKERGISIMIISEDVKIEVLDEKEMNRVGWYKKGKIITL